MLPSHYPPLPTKLTSIHPSSLTTAENPDPHVHIMPQSSTVTFPFSQNPNHPATFTSKPSSTPVIPSAPNTKRLGLSPLDTAHPILQPLKLFFERFPSWVDYHDLKKAFLKFGRVSKLFISKRKTTLGRRFGFVDILSSMSVNDLCDNASSLWFDTYKLRVNPAKHSPSTPALTPTKTLPKPAPLYPPKLLFRDNRSFIEVLTSTKPAVVSDERRIINYNSTAEDKEWLSRSLVGKILPNADVASMEEMVLKSVENAVSFRFLGASQVIVTFEDQLTARKEQNNASSFLYSLLSNLRQWEARICAYDRFAWISIFGLPMEGWNRNCIDALLQSWGNIVGYDTSCVSQGSISGIRVLIRTSKLEPLQDQVLLNLDGIQVEVSLIEIKGTHIPSLTTVKHSMDVSYYTASGLSDDDEDEHGDASMRATLSHRTTGQSAEFEFDHIAALGINNSYDKALTEQVMPPMYLYPELSEPCKQAALAKESVYEVDNCLALVQYDVAAADYRIVVGQPVVCLSEVKELDQVGGFSEHEKTGRKQRQKQLFIGPATTATSTDTGPSFTNFIQPIADPSDLCILESKNKKSQKHRAKRIKRKTSSLSRRKSHKLAHHRQKQPETVIIEYSVSDNGIKNRNAIICCGKEHVGDDEANSSHYQSPAAHGNQVADSLRSGSWEEANACWEVGKAILQVHDDNHLMTQTLQGLIDNEQEEWLRRKNDIVVWNVCGLGSRVKKRCVRNLGRKLSIDVLGILETKLENIHDSIISSIWGRHARDWYAVPSIGLSGGILCIWNPASFCVSRCSIALNGRILHVEGTFTRYNLDCLVSFIYAPIDGTLKKELWDYLITFKDSVSTPWCLAGDFNETLSSSDRKGGSKVSAAMSRFKQCIDSCELLDLPLNGKRFTWSRGNAASRIDRIFVSGDWLQLLPASTLFGLPRFSSDHRPLQLLLDYKNWGPKPFRFMNCWWLMADFRKMIQSFWNSISVSSTGRGNMVSAFKMLKERCKHWNKEVVGNMSNQIKELESEADSLDNLKECRDLSADELIRSNVIVSKLRTLYIMQESIWHQKSRVQWCKLGDKNTRFFHLAATIRQKRNLISSLEVDGNMLSKPAEMKIAVFNFFRNLYSHHDRPRPSCYHLEFQKLKPSSSVALECPFSTEEIKAAVWDCEGNKAPGPDGINFTFIKKAWSTIGGDITRMVEDFYQSNLLPSGINNSFVTLIPKINCAAKLADFRPISLVGSLYKIISKLLAIRLKHVMPEVITDNQTAFIKGRQILDSVLIANEAIAYIKENHGKAYLFKLDFHKAFDSVIWEYINEVMASMGFGSRWRGWIMQCISTAKMSVLVNGSPTEEFSLEKGLRQGDPLSPFLFNLAVQGLSCMLQRGCDMELIEGLNFSSSGPALSHLQFADDTLIFSSASLSSLQNIKHILLCFELISGLKVNFYKSSIIGVGIEDHVCRHSAQILRCKQELLPITYLGLPIGANMNRVSMWKPIISKISSRLAAWKGRFLSIGGRLCLLKSVLSNLPIYYLSLFPMPATVATTIERKFRSFLWSGKEESRKLCNVSWSTVSLPKRIGGLGIGSLRDKNTALLYKWQWRLGSEESSLWKEVIKFIHNTNSSSFLPQTPLSGTGSTWTRMINHCIKDNRLQEIVSHQSMVLIGNGKRTTFWHDIWVANHCLANRFPTLYRLSNDKDASIDKMGMWDGFEWIWLFSWSRPLRGRNIGLLEQLYIVLSKVHLDSESEDRLIWKDNKSGRFSVKSLCGLLSPTHYSTNGFSFAGIWKGVVPPKVEIFCWMAIINRLNTRGVLVRRGVLDSSHSNCPICQVEEESVDHLLLHCHNHWIIWSKIIKWWGLSWCCPKNLSCLFSQWTVMVQGKFQKKAWLMLFFSVVWSLWLLRNDLIFRQKSPNYDSVFFLIIARLCLWLKALHPDFPYSPLDMLRSSAGLIRWSNVQIYRTGVIWSPPPIGRFKWNVDGSSLGKPGLSGIGGALRNHQGHLLGIFSLQVGILDSNIAELRAVVKAIELSASKCFLHHKHIIIESDSANVISWMHNPHNRPWMHRDLFSTVQKLTSLFGSITFSHVYRESNSLADCMAKQGVHRSSDFIAWL